METKNNGIVMCLLGIMFVGLKLTGYIDWSWWLVLLPFYISIVIVVGIVLIAVIGCVFVAIIKNKW